MDSRVNPGQRVAVLTGDIVESSKLASDVRARLPDAILQVAGIVSHYFPAYVPYTLDIFRGDSWQWLVTMPDKSLKLAIFMRSLLRNTVQDVDLDTRIAIGIGKVQMIPEGDLARADGDAFRRSGELLDSFGRGDRMGVSLPRGIDSTVAEALRAVVQLIDLQVRQWTDKQAHAVCAAILGFTQRESARLWFKPSISQQAVGQHLDRAGWSTLEIGLAFYEHAVRSLVFNKAE
jgi:hypothetical protein